MWLGGERSGLILLAFFICYGIAALGDGIVGVPWADLAGTSLDNRWRARVLGFTAAASGIIMLLIAPLFGRILGESGPGFPNNYAILFGVSGILFVLSIVPGFFFHELPGGKAVEKLASFREFLPELGQGLRQDIPFRAFIVTRIFTSLFLMAAPFYIGYATVELELSSEVAVPVLLAMQTAGGLLGALIYTWLGARNNLRYIQLALLSAALLPISALLSGFVGPILLYIGFAVSGLSTGFNLTGSYINWVVTYASPDRRPIYVGLSNTIIALVAFVTPVIGGTIVQSYGHRLLFITALVMALSALFVTLRFIPNTQVEKTDFA